MSFRRGLGEPNFFAWLHMVSKIVPPADLTKGKDVFLWNLHMNGAFTKTSYAHEIDTRGSCIEYNPTMEALYI